MNRLLVCAMLLAATPAAAEDLPYSEAKLSDLPARTKPRGKKIERVATFTDKLGTNYIVFSSTRTDKPNTTWLFVDHWAIAKGKAPRALLPARDVEKDCEYDLTAEFVNKAFHVTDLDADGIAEVTYGYQLACRSDVSPATYKLLLVENGKKHILRGIAIHDRVMDGEGRFTPEPGEKKWDAKLFAHAVAVWNATSLDVTNQE